MDDSITQALKDLSERLAALEARVTALDSKVKPTKQADKPQIEQVKAYAQELGLPPEEATHFFDHFTANGWRIGGKAPMKDWQAALRNWHRNFERYKKPKLLEKEQRQQALADDEFWTPPAEKP